VVSLRSTTATRPDAERAVREEFRAKMADDKERCCCGQDAPEHRARMEKLYAEALERQRKRHTEKSDS